MSVGRQFRILHVVGTATGGDWFVDQVATLRARGHTILAVTPDEGALTDRLRDSGIPTVVVRFKGRRLRDIPRTLYSQLQLVRLVRAYRPHILHAHLFKAILVGRVAGLIGRVPLRVSQWPGSVHWDSTILRLLDRLTMPIDHVVIGSCRAITDHYAEMRGSDRVATSYYGLDVRKWDPTLPHIVSAANSVRQELRVASDAPLVGMVSYMYPTTMARFRDVGVKGHETFIDAAARMLRRHSLVTFLVVGDEFAGAGEYRARLERRAVLKGLSGSIHFLGHRTDIDRLTAALDVLVVPSLSESASYAAIQAGLLQRPVVASRVGGLPDSVKDGETGLLVPSADAEELASAVSRLLQDWDLRTNMGQRGRCHALETFDLERTVSSLEAIYLKHWQRVRA